MLSQFQFYQDVVLDGILLKHEFNDKKQRGYLFIKAKDHKDFLEKEKMLEWLTSYNYILNPVFLQFVSDYFVMYIGRILQPFILKIKKFNNTQHSLYFTDYFVYLQQKDEYFRKKKTFRS